MSNEQETKTTATDDKIMSETTNDGDSTGIERKPDIGNLTNGEVRVVLDISDPVTDLGIVTDRISVESNGKVSEVLAEHIWDELLIDVKDHGIEVYD